MTAHNVATEEKNKIQETTIDTPTSSSHIACVEEEPRSSSVASGRSFVVGEDGKANGSGHCQIWLRFSNGVSDGSCGG